MYGEQGSMTPAAPSDDLLAALEAPPELVAEDEEPQAEGTPGTTVNTPASGEDMVAVNKNNRLVAGSFWSNAPLTYTMIVRLCMESHRRLFKEQYNMSSPLWEVLERQKAAKDLTYKRQFRIGVVASMTFEDECIRQIGTMLREPGIWSYIPKSSCNYRFRGLAFRLLSKQGCCVEELLRQPSRLAPTCAFATLVDPTKAAAVQAMKPCLRDEWLADLLQDHPDLSTDDAQAYLLTHALYIEEGNIQVERWNACIRRWLYARSVQTHTMDSEGFSAEWRCQQERL